MIRIRLHESATAESLALARILIFATWIVYVLVDPIQRLALLPTELFHPFGVFRWLPSDFWAALLTPAGLLGLTLVCLALFVWAGIGLPAARWAAGAAVVIALVYLQAKKGFGGHFDHRELTLVYVTAALLLTPAWDAFAVRRAPARPRRHDVYRASLILLSLVVILQYVFIGAARMFIGGPGVFMGGTLQNWIENRNLRPNPFGFDIGTAFLDPIWAVPLDLLFLGGTLLEIAAIIVLFLPAGWFKVVFVIGFAVFHMSIFLLMNVAFPENIVLLLLFFDLAWPLRRMRRGHEDEGLAFVDPANARASAFRERVGEVSRVPFADRSGASGGLEFRAESGATAEGEAARTEILYRTPGRLVTAWVRDRVLRRSGPVRPERSGLGRWLFGPLTS
ncbi:hypothetical protein ACFUTX_12830 [Microbacterium sp. NPDC057407]|uniref:hypothetical protein n=1 Tax=Microbacterium sp. NPDC057407 TaxID=3346120 RepID=UPI00366F5624